MSSGVTPDDIKSLAYDYAKMGWLFGYKEGYFEWISIITNRKSRKLLEKYVNDELARENKYERSILFRLLNMSLEERETFFKKLKTRHA